MFLEEFIFIIKKLNLKSISIVIYNKNNMEEIILCGECNVSDKESIKLKKKYVDKKCEHNITKKICKICNPKAYCEHDKLKNNCKDCGGMNICEHRKQKSQCKECCGISFCIHGKYKSTCKDCKGSNICIHNKNKGYCKECSSLNYCEHNREKRRCKICKGSGICIHDKQKRKCFECKGNEICIHKKQKPQCKLCGGSSLCKSEWCEKIANKKYEGYCLFCYVNLFPDKPITRNYKTKEKDVVDRILKLFPNFTWITDKKIQDGCSRRRPDLLLDMGSHIIIVEIDENAHTNYDCSCENKRLMEISQDLLHRPIIFIRFNPDDYMNKDGNKIKSCWKLNMTTGLIGLDQKKLKEWEERINSLVEQINYWIKNSTEKTVEIVELFY
jgi:hypothetical protein